MAWQLSGGAQERREEAVERILQIIPSDEAYPEVALYGLGLSTLPPLPEHVDSLDARNNPLVALGSLPYSLALLQFDPTSGFDDMAIDGSRLAMADSSSQTQDAMALPRVAASWYRGDNRAIDKARQWQSFVDEPSADEFCRFLSHLAKFIGHDTVSHFSEPFQACVKDWLDHLANHPALRTDTFALSLDASATCEDRALLTLLRMLRLGVVHEVNAGAYDRDVPKVVELCRNMMWQEKLEQIALRKIEALAHNRRAVVAEQRGWAVEEVEPYHFAPIDEVEVILAYLVRARDELELPLPVSIGVYTHEGVSDVSDGDLAQAIEEVRAEDAAFVSYLHSSDLWLGVLERRYPMVFAEAQQLLHKWIDEGTYDSYVKGYVREHMPGMEADPDAQRQAGPAVMAKLRHMVYEPLTDALLRGR